MLLAIAAVLAGFVLLVWSADRFVMGAAGLAYNLGVSSLLIGLTIVGFGTSAPEIMVSGMAALQGNPGLAIGNAVGSNIANIGLILGVTAIVIPLTVKSSILRQEYPILLGISIGTYLLLKDGELNFLDSIIMLGGLVITLGWMIYLGRKRQTDLLVTEYSEEVPHNLSTLSAVMWLLIGLALLIASSRMLVWGAVEIATALGVSDLVIGLTIVAIGTSLPELATSITSALKGEHDIAVGNIIGSNIYNLLAVLSVPGLVAPTLVGEDVLSRDLPLMLGLTLAILIMGIGRNGNGRINRVEGTILLCCFIGYQSWLLTSVLNP